MTNSHITNVIHDVVFLPKDGEQKIGLQIDMFFCKVKTKI